MGNLKYDTVEPIYETEKDSVNSRTDILKLYSHRNNNKSEKE